ncbi:MAG: biopolymer transporter ExbD [Planctomycetaceae bacterium]|nr:biopolymer transporter ExbD [Planctomycetaceae bacterium]
MKTVFFNRKTKTLELKMTPMIDVIFLLLVFFVCTASFIPPEGVLPTNMSLPGSSVTEIVLPKPDNLDVARILLTFDGSPHWRVEGNQCHSLRDVRTILQKLREIRQDIPVIIDSNENVPMEHVIDVYDSCRIAGLSQIQFAAKQNP